MAKNVNAMTSEELIDYVQLLYSQNNFNKIIETLTDKTLEKHNRAELYTERADAFLQIDEWIKALQDVNKAIEINSDYADAYSSRGDAYIELGRYQDAIIEYNRAINLDPDNSYFYLDRGVAWLELKSHEKALEDLNRSIELNPNNGMAYFFRGNIWRSNHEYYKAIDDYNLAIKFSPKFSYAYNNRGNTWDDIGDIAKAEQDYIKAIGLDPNSLAKRNLDILKKKIKLESYELFNEAVLKLQDSEKHELKKLFRKIKIDYIDKIYEYTHLQNNVCQLVAHYTNLKTADKIIIYNEQDESKMRFYNAVYMNDPEEGEIVLECLNDDVIKDCFNEARKEEENCIYIGSFLPAQWHEDELIMWRTYGKDEKKVEASGCSVVIDTSFFDSKWTALRIKKDIDKKFDNNGSEIASQALYSVLYYSKNDNIIVNDEDNKIMSLLQELKNTLKELIALKHIKSSEEKNIAINKIVYHIISEIRYFFKSADYSFESEARVLQFMKPDDEKVKIDDNSGQWLPRRLYIESNKSIIPYIRKIILGPKVPNPNQWIYLEAAMKKKGYNISLVRSECKYQ